jgi:UDP:flavonoid glycosyltransferase YjiC (YdhE family)
MDAVLCHAGHNTVCEALSFGLPLIVAPIRDDQPVVARQVIDAGAALHLRYGKVTAASARTAVEELFHKTDYRDNALRLKKSFESLGGARHAADVVEELLSREGSAAGMRPNLARPGVSRAMG